MNTNAIPGILRELHFDEVYTLEIAFLQSFCIYRSMRRRCVSMALPKTPGQRISDLCNGNHLIQKELAEKIGVSASQLSRIVSGETRTVSSDILIGVAKEFKVSTYYILAL
jgi:DNA-binding Xre family transcriptional regulator